MACPARRFRIELGELGKLFLKITRCERGINSDDATDRLNARASLVLLGGFRRGGRRCRRGGDGISFRLLCPAPVIRSITERTASRVLRSLTASSSGADAGERRIRLSGSGKISGSSHGPCTTKGRSNPGAAFDAVTRLAMPFRSYSRVGTEAVPVRVSRAGGLRCGRPRRWRCRRRISPRRSDCRRASSRSGNCRRRTAAGAPAVSAIVRH